jgi:Fic family protein
MMPEHQFERNDKNMKSKGFEPKFTITNRITAGLTRIERARGFLEAATLSENWVREMGNRALVLEAHHTTHIEGTRLTLGQAERLWQGDSVPEADPDDARELLNYRKAFDFVSEYLKSGDPITEGLVREIHKRLVEGVRGGAADPDEYRRIQNYVVNSVTGETIYTPPPAHDVPIMMAELVNYLDSETEAHSVLKSGIAQFQLVHIHPFLDGNGRTSRLLSTLYLYRAGYDFKRLFTISEYYDRDRAIFYRAIQGVRESNMDMTGWLEFFIEGLGTQLAEVKERGEQAIHREVMAKQHNLSNRQAMALAHILVHGSLTIKDFERFCSRVTRRTLQRDLKLMIDKGLFAEKATSPTDPTKHYVLVDNPPKRSAVTSCDTEL